MIVCTSERLARSADGRSDGLDLVTTTFAEVSIDESSVTVCREKAAHSRTLAYGAAHGASQCLDLRACASIEQVSAVIAEHQRADCSHCGWCNGPLSRSCRKRLIVSE